jgi:hypothetical protein
MPIQQMIYQGLQFDLVWEARGWAANIPRFGKTMYFPSEEAAINEAVRLMDAFVLPRRLRRDEAA